MKTKFTLHPEHENFIPRVSHLDFKTLGLSCGTMGCLLPITLISILMAVAMGFAIYHYNIEPLLFRLFGQEITAQVTECDVIEGEHNDQIGHFYTYIYTWKAMTYSGTGSVYGGALGDCREYINQPITAQMQTAHPSQSLLLSNTTEQTFTSATILVTGLFFILTAFALCYSYVRYIHARWIYPRLIRKGRLQEGYITQISCESGSKSGKFYVRVKYQFESPEGRILKGSAYVHRPDLKGADLPPVGTPVVILYADDWAHMAL